MSLKCYNILNNWHTVAINDDKRINMCAKLAGGILAHGKVYFKCRYENKARHIDAFLVGSGLHTGGPIVKKVNFKQNFRPKKCASIPPIFLGCHFSKKIPQKKVKGVQCSKFDTNILVMSLKTVRSLRTVTFILKVLFKSLRVKNERHAYFFRTFFSSFS